MNSKANDDDLDLTGLAIPKLRRENALLGETISRYMTRDGSIIMGNLDLSDSSNSDILQKLLPWSFSVKFYGLSTCRDQVRSFLRRDHDNPDNDGQAPRLVMA